MADDAKYTDSTDSEIKEIREEFTYAKNEKSDIRAEGDTDMRYISGDPFEAEDHQARRDAGRVPLVTPDELGQYGNQLINDVRQNKRGVRLAPAGLGSNKKTAELRENLIRQIDYRSNSALDADPVMFENAINRSYGYLRIMPYRDPREFDYELRIGAIPNPNMVVEDPHALSPTGKDWKFLYFSEMWSKADAKRKWPHAKKWVSFDNGDAARHASEWVKGERLMVAERWRIVTKPRTLLLIQPPMGPDGRQAAPFTEFKDAKDLLAKMPPGSTVLKDRIVDFPTVKQQIVNGVEILEEVDFPGTSIPFVGCYGKILYIDDKKHILSLVRLARSPFQLYCYYRTQQAEMAGMIPKAPVIGYKGQFAGFEQDFEKAPHEPMAFMEANFTAPEWPLQTAGPMPLPQRLAYEAGAHLQALELCAEGARRAIQAAIGASPLPTQAQRQNEKSGVALKQIEDTAQKGSFHFIDHYDASQIRKWEIVDELLPFYYDAAREVTIRKGNDEPIRVRINDPDVEDSQNVTSDPHDVTISVGPRQVSERQAASEFADTILGSELMKLLQPHEARRIAALAIRLKSVGPFGDEMADVLSPEPTEDGKPTPQQVEGLQQQVQLLQQQLQQAVQALETDAAKQQAQVAMKEMEAKTQVVLQHMKNAADIHIAEVNAATKGYTVDAAHAADHEKQALGHAVAADEADRARAHEAGEAERGRQHERDETDIAAERERLAAERAHEQALEQGEASSRQAMEQAANQAALTPPETGA